MAEETKETEAPIAAPNGGGAKTNAPDILTTDLLPAAPRVQSAGVRAWLKGLPFLSLAVYYVLLVSAVVLASTASPTVREAFFAPVAIQSVITRSDAEAVLQGDTSGISTPRPSQVEELDEIRIAGERSLQTLLVIIGSLLLVVPVAWVYMKTKRLQYDPALVRSVIILPIVVAGITMVVKYSIALAFALAGIVAAVRFRNTLKDPRDAVYIFLVIGIGLASGVQALDVALVMSMLFNFVMLTLWRYNIGSIYGGGYGQTGVLTAGDPGMFVAQVPSVRKDIRRSLLKNAEEMETDGVLLVHAEEVEQARYTVQEALGEMAKEWRLVRVASRDEGVSTLQYLVRMKKKASPADLVGALDERWSAQVLAAEYFPFLQRATEREGESDDSKKS